jgi:hypothetical protein
MVARGEVLLRPQTPRSPITEAVAGIAWRGEHADA